jgi:hypothetical protein
MMPSIDLPETGTCRVTLLRRRGKRLKTGDAEHEQQYRGDVTSQWRDATHIVTMRTGLPSDSRRRLPPDLHSPTLESIGFGKMRLLGFEAWPEGSTVQEWVVEFRW